jgi:hypothetical protein
VLQFVYLDAEPISEKVDRHKADIMPGILIAPPRISETDYRVHSASFLPLYEKFSARRAAPKSSSHDSLNINKYEYLPHRNIATRDFPSSAAIILHNITAYRAAPLSNAYDP